LQNWWLSHFFQEDTRYIEKKGVSLQTVYNENFTLSVTGKSRKFQKHSNKTHSDTLAADERLDSAWCFSFVGSSADFFSSTLRDCDKNAGLRADNQNRAMFCDKY